MRSCPTVPRSGVSRLALLCVGCFAILPIASSAAPFNSARVTQIIKEVTLLPSGGASRPASVSDEVGENSAVRTGNDSRAELTFTDLTITRMGANTVFSFNRGKREIDLASGAVLVQVPKNGDAATVRTAAATAAVSGGTAMVEFHVGYPLKVYVLEGVTKVCTPSGDCVTLPAGQMLTSSDGKLNKPASYNVAKLYQTSLLLTDFAPLPNDDLIQQEIQQQQTDNPDQPPPPQSSNKDNNSNITDVVDTATSANPPTTTNLPPSEFGPPSTITTPNPYVIGPGTQIQTDPSITTNGVTNFGTIYRSFAQDGEPTQFLFGEAPNALDSLVFDNGGDTHPIAVFKFAGLQLTGNPTVTIGASAPERLALVSVGDITSGGPGGTLTFAPATRLSLITQNGSINLGSEISFSGLDHIEMYARGSSSTLSLASPISNVNVVKLASGGDINVTGSISATSRFDALAQGNFNSASTSITSDEIDIRTLDGDIHIFDAITPLDGNNHVLTGSINAAGSLTAAGDVFTGTVQTGTSINVGGQLQASSIAAGTDITTGGTLEIGKDPNGNFGNITAGGNIVANGGIFTPGTPCVVSATGSITVSDGGIITGTLQAGGAISVGNSSAGGGFVGVNSITAGDTLTFNNISSISPDNSVASGGLSFTPVDMTITAPTISSSGPNYPALAASGADASEASVANPGNGGNISIDVTASGLAVGNAQDIATISADGGGFDNGTPTGGGNGGSIHITAAGNVAIDPPDPKHTNITISATTGTVPNVFSQFAGAGGTVTVNSPGTIGVSGTILVSSDDARNFSIAPNLGGGTPGRESASGGNITLQSSATLGIGINVSGSLLSLLNNSAPGPGGTITLSTMGANIIVTGTVEADRGTVVMDQNDPVGATPSISLQGASITADALTITGAGDVDIGTTSGIFLNVGSFSLTAPGSFHLQTGSIGTDTFTAASTGGGDVQMLLTSTLSLNGAITLSSAVPNGSVVSTGANVALNVLNFTDGAAADSSALQVTNQGQIGTGGNVGLIVGGNLVANTLNLTVQNTSATIGTGGNATMSVGGSVTMAGPLQLLVENYDFSGNTPGNISNGGNVSLTTGGNLTAQAVTEFVNNRSGGNIGSSVDVTLNVTGALTTTGSATDPLGFPESLSLYLSTRADSTSGPVGGSLVDGSGSITVTADSAAIGGSMATFISDRGSEINGNAAIQFTINNSMDVSFGGDVEILNGSDNATVGAGTIQGSASIDFAASSFSANSFFTTISNSRGGYINGDATITFDVSGLLTASGLNAGGDFDPVSPGAFTVSIQNQRGGGTIGGYINGSAGITLNAGSISTASMLEAQINNNNGGTIQGNATIDISSRGDFTADSLLVQITNLNTGLINGDASETISVGGNATVTNDAIVEINGTDPAGVAAINIDGGNYTVGGQFFSQIDGNGAITLTNATIHADVLKIGVFGPNGLLKIGGGTLSANTELKLYAPGSLGTVEFVANVTLDGGSSAAIIAANTVTIDSGKTVFISGSTPAAVYTNNANYGNATFGNFAGAGATTSSLSGAPGFGAAPVAPPIVPAVTTSTSPVTTAVRATAASTAPLTTVTLANSSDLRSVVDQAQPTSGGRINLHSSDFASRYTSATVPGQLTTGTKPPRSMAGVSTVESPANPAGLPVARNTSTTGTDSSTRFSR